MTQNPPRTYLFPAIVTALVFFPVGAFAIKFALQVNKKYESGDYEGAELASKQARKFCIIGALVSCVIYLLPLLGIGYFSILPNNINAQISCTITKITKTQNSNLPEPKIVIISQENSKKETEKVDEFHFNYQYLSGKNNDEENVFEISVNPNDDKKNIEVSRYKIPRSKHIRNQFFIYDSSNINNFTGLRDVYHPKLESRLRYWCVANYHRVY